MPQHNHFAPFLKQMIKRPHRTVALAPSSRALCAAMVAGLDPEKGSVIELGPGTGKITESLVANGFDPSQLSLFELNKDFYNLLINRFPKADIHFASASACQKARQKHVQACVSGLPLLSFSGALQREILTAAFGAMGREGVFVQYTYGYKTPVRLQVMKALDLRSEPGVKIWGNLPPARVYRLSQSAK